MQAKLVKQTTDLTGAYVVTGASGYIGVSLVRALLALDTTRQIFCIDKRPLKPATLSQDRRVTTYDVDISDRNALRQTFDEILYRLASQATVFHLAALYPKDAATRRALRSKDYYRDNVIGTANLVDILCTKPQPWRLLVFTSTSLVRDDSSTDSYGNTDLGLYAKSKAEGEQLVRRACIDWTVLRPVRVVGIGTRIRNDESLPSCQLDFESALTALSDLRRSDLLPRDIISDLMEKAFHTGLEQSGGLSVFNSNSKRSYLHLIDMVDALQVVSRECPVGQTINLVSGPPIPLGDIGRILCTTLAQVNLQVKLTLSETETPSVVSLSYGSSMPWIPRFSSSKEVVKIASAQYLDRLVCSTSEDET